MSQVKLYSYFRSSCSWRVRIALTHKKIPYELQPVNLLKGEQKDASYASNDVNPSALVPTLEIDGKSLSQSLAILEYLEEREAAATQDPSLALLPPVSRPFERFLTREIAHIIGCDTQPVQNLRVLKDAKALSGKGDQFDAGTEWAAPIIRRGFTAVENCVLRNREKGFATGKGFLVGDRMSLADICVVCQCTNAIRFGVDLQKEFPLVADCYQKMMEIPAVVDTAPERQPDATV